MTDFAQLAGKEMARGSFSWDADRALLYAVGVGAGAADPYEELQFTTENTEGVAQQVIPSFFTQMSPGGDWIRQLGFKARVWDGIDWGYPEGLVHGEQGFALARPIPPAGTVHMVQKMVGVFDKGSGALAIAETTATLDSGELLGTSRAGMFVRGQGGFGGPRAPEGESVLPRPDRAPGHDGLDRGAARPVADLPSAGDRNPHGTDPARARADGFTRPIFFGLGTYGFACRALLKGLCGGDAARFGAMDARFSKPMHPGDRLDTRIWHTADGAQFECAANGESVVIDRGVFRFAG